jgi:hypothetical protein
MGVFGNMKGPDPKFPLMKDTIAVIEVGLPFAKGLYFRAGEHNAGNVFVVEKIFEICMPVFDFHLMNVLSLLLIVGGVGISLDRVLGL